MGYEIKYEVNEVDLEVIRGFGECSISNRVGVDVRKPWLESSKKVVTRGSFLNNFVSKNRKVIGYKYRRRHIWTL